MEKLDAILDVFEKSTKRLAVPTAMLTAAFLMGKDTFDKWGSILPLGPQIVVLSLAALLYVFASGMSGINKIYNLELSTFKFVSLCTVFFISHFILAVFGITIILKNIA